MSHTPFQKTSASPNFDAAMRRAVETRLAEMNPSDRRFCRGDFFALIGATTPTLEIGPLASPVLRGAQVRYFDVLPTEELRRKAARHGMNPENCPEIHYHSDSADLAVIPDRFGAVVSSHAIEHQPDLVGHLNKVADLLEIGSCYWIACPDKRYCFDHFIRESSIIDVIDAHARGAMLHSVASVTNQLAMTTHNEPLRHWNGDHGEPAYRTDPNRLAFGAHTIASNPGRYVDSHAWQFVPQTFREITQLLCDLDYSVLEPVRVFDTAFGSNEFYAVLQKVREKPAGITIRLPPDFDAELYLRANPDVAQAGVDAAEHYRCYGAREGRRLRPA